MKWKLNKRIASKFGSIATTEFRHIIQWTLPNNPHGGMSTLKHPTRKQ
jgi:hypothetical protein